MDKRIAIMVYNYLMRKKMAFCFLENGMIVDRIACLQVMGNDNKLKEGL